MSVKVKDLMSKSVVTAQPHQTVGQLRAKMGRRKLNNVPVVSTDNEPIGMVSATDLFAAEKEGTPVSNIMTEKVYSIPEYENIAVAARMMRNHKIHHLTVTSEKTLIGIISSFELLKLVEDHRFVMKNASTPKAAKKGKRARVELN